MIGGNDKVTKLFFLACLSVVHKMERHCLKESGRKGKCLFEPNLREAVGCRMSELASAVSAVPAPPAESNNKQKADIALVKNLTFSSVLCTCTLGAALEFVIAGVFNFDLLVGGTVHLVRIIAVFKIKAAGAHKGSQVSPNLSNKGKGHVGRGEKVSEQHRVLHSPVLQQLENTLVVGLATECL
jgi:hypothetical protein